MSTINIDVMKQLLQEFVEKEALASEEVKVVQQQIEELELRIKACHDKLKVVSEDKGQINAMLQRYAGGMGLSPTGGQVSLSSGAVPSASASQIGVPVPSAPPSAVGATNLAQALAETNPPVLSKAEAQSKSGSVKPLDAIMAGAAESAPAAPPEKPPESAEEPAAKAEEPAADETPEDAVKSINDALRGLFR